MAVKCDRKRLLFFGCTYKGHRLDVRFGALLDCLQFTFLSNHLAIIPQKSHECALKRIDLWNTSLLCDLNYKFINGSFAFSPG